MNTSCIEVEVRAPLPLGQIDTLIQRLKEKGAQLKDERVRTNYLYTNIDPAHDRLDLRVRETNGIAELVLKIGAMGDAQREEFCWPLGSGETVKAQRFLAALGFAGGVVTPNLHSNVFAYRDMEVVVAWIPDHSAYVEVEILCEDSSLDRSQLESHARSVLAEFGLEEFSAEAYAAYLKQLHDEVSQEFSVAL